MDSQTGALRDFETFLSTLGTIPNDKIKFYVHWVRRFLKSCNFQLENINAERLSQYLDSLEADEKVADWQVKQGADAVILYVEQYLKKPLKQGIPSGGDSGAASTDRKAPFSWEQTLGETKNAIRLRHYSLSTEKTVSPHGTADVWVWPSPYGVSPPKDKGRGFRKRSPHGSLREG